MSSECPTDNSSDTVACLLRSIEANTTPHWSWDPLNFSVTTAIGVLAFIVACVTVFQQLLAAGPGRLKASNLAIGPFSVHSRSRIDRTEFALRTTARVPLITWDVVFHRIVRQKFRPTFDYDGRRHRRKESVPAGVADDDSAYDGITTLGTTSVNERHQYDSTATWLTLLTALGLDDPTLFPLIQRVTDYLPVDIQAAPAAGELRCLAILAAIADTNASIEASGPSGRFVTVSADSSQLSWRDHQTLGSLAAYEAYEESAMLKVGTSPPLRFGSEFPTLKFEDLDRCLQLASGRLVYGNGRIPASIDNEPDERGFMPLVTDLKSRAGSCGHEVCEHAVEDWLAAVGGIREHRKAWRLFKNLKAIYMAVSLLAGERANMCRAFPRQKMSLDDALRNILGLVEFWSTDLSWQKLLQLQRLAYLTFWRRSNVPLAPTLSASWVVEFKDIGSTILNPFTNTFKSRQDFREDRTLNFVQAIRRFITRQMNPNDPAIDDIEEQTLPPATTAQLLACLDDWLLRKGGSDAACCMLHLMYRLGIQTELLANNRQDTWQPDSLASKIVSQGTEGKGSGPTPNGQISTDRKSFGGAKVVTDHMLEGLDLSVMVVLRGVLMALQLNDGADTSILFQHDFRNSVVKVL